ncbi:A1 protein [Rhizobium phage RHph_Y2_17_1]|nr:A1 protein [Rhizobium phage RHph_Y2_11]QIG75807.1 A1 protein [Rhizobium phage RHph_Y2_17_1]
MNEAGPETTLTREDETFIRVYNDPDTYPFLADVAYELKLSYQTVRNKAAIMRGRKRAGENIPELISRVGVRSPGKEKVAVDPMIHANARATHLREQLHALLGSSRYPVINPDALVVEGTLNERYDRTSGNREKSEGIPRTWLTDILKVEGVVDPRGRRFILSGAQNDCPVDGDFWQNLQAYANFLDADIIIGPGTYETQWWAENNTVVRSYAPEIQEYLCFGQMEIGDNFVFAGEMNMLPTANRPIGDLASYSRGKWTVFPHAKIQLKSVPSLDPAKQAHQVLTTGMVTRPKIIPRKAGIKALSSHKLGAVLLEFNQAGKLFVRHLLADTDGSFHDFEFFVKDGVVEIDEEGVDLAVLGDFHNDKEDRKNYDATFRAPNSLVRSIRPKRVIIHDIFDNYRRNHHNVHDNAHSFEVAVRGRESVADEVKGVVYLLDELRKTAAVTVVESNHDIALERYVREGRYRNDGINIRFGLQLEDRYLAWREEVAMDLDAGRKPRSFSLLEYAVNLIAEREGIDLSDVHWVHDGQSFVVNGVECGHHGFRGANGARGSVAGYAALGRPMNIGDKHSSEILDEVYVSGVKNLQQGYNKGPSGWTVTDTIQYRNGKRTLVTYQDGAWRA